MNIRICVVISIIINNIGCFNIEGTSSTDKDKAKVDRNFGEGGSGEGNEDTSSSGSCIPKSCQEIASQQSGKANAIACGVADNGCGNDIDCGGDTCVDGTACGVGFPNAVGNTEPSGMPNVCGGGCKYIGEWQACTDKFGNGYDIVYYCSGLVNEVSNVDCQLFSPDTEIQMWCCKN